MQVAALGHTSTPTNLAWLRGELLRVLDKMQPDYVHVPLDSGCAIELAEAVILAEFPLILHPLIPIPQWLRYIATHPGAVDRTRVIVSCANDILTPTSESVSRGARRQQSLELAEIPHQLVIYDGRHHGSVLDHLQRVMGTHNVVIVDPAEERTVRLPPQETSP